MVGFWWKESKESMVPCHISSPRPSLGFSLNKEMGLGNGEGMVTGHGGGGERMEC